MNIKQISAFDKGFVFKTYANMSKQFNQVFDEFKNVNLGPINKIDKILVCGMGGSTLGPHFVRSVFASKISVPIIISNEYDLPAWVDKKTLVVISTFSGTTEESLNCFRQARKKKFNMFCIGSETFEVGDTPHYLFNSKYNYAKNPRFAVGYSVASFVMLLIKLGFLKYDILNMRKEIKIFSKGKVVAEKMVKNILNKIPVIISSEHLTANAHVFQNQFNETGKTFSTYFFIPEICHHQFEGLTFPKGLNKEIVYVLINSRLYNVRNQKRYEIMKEILNKKKIKFVEINAVGRNFFEQSMYVLGLSSYLAFYLAYMNKIDPQPNPWVDYLKERMRT